MFTDDPVAQATPQISFAPSMATDLSWLLCGAAKQSMRDRYPQLAAIFSGREDLAERVRAFWGDGAEETAFTEMHIASHYAGALYETDPDALWQALEAGIATVPLELDVPSESPEEIAVYRERFRRLKESPTLVRSYLDLMKEVWEPVNEMWQQALPLIEEAGRHVVTQYESGVALETLITPGCDILRERLPVIQANFMAGKPLVFVPCLFFGSSMYLDFPELVIIGTGADTANASARARTESVAKRLKALADPTRLAILHFVAAAPSSVSELAVLFGLAQPTVSMHVKVLRDNGLVRSEREGGRIRLSADPVAVESLLGDLRGAVLHEAALDVVAPAGASTTGNVRMPATVVESTRSTEPVTA